MSDTMTHITTYSMLCHKASKVVYCKERHTI